MTMPKIYIIILMLCFSLASTYSQTCCSAGAPITSSFDIGHSGNNNGVALQLSYEYKSVNRLVDNNQILVNDPRNRSGQNVLLKTDWLINQHWAISAFLPFVIQNRTTFSETQSATGLGDLTLLGQYSQAIKEQGLVKFALGIKVPTGSQFILDNRGITLSPDMQSGSGTYDFIARLAYAKSHFLIPNLNFQNAISYRYNTTNAHFGDPQNIGGRNFKFGNELLLNSSFNYLLVIGTSFASPELGIQLRHSSPNEERELPAPNSGGWWLSIPLAWQWIPSEQISLGIYGEIPVWQQLEGLQITTNYSAGIRFRYYFNNKNSIF